MLEGDEGRGNKTPVFKDLKAEEVASDTTEIESLCLACGKNVITVNPDLCQIW